MFCCFDGDYGGNYPGHRSRGNALTRPVQNYSASTETVGGELSMIHSASSSMMIDLNFNVHSGLTIIVTF